MSEPWEVGEAVIQDETGLHARPAVKLTKLAKRFSSRVEIKSEESDSWSNAKSPNAVMKLKVPHRATLMIRAAGADAGQAVTALSMLIDRDFDDSQIE